MSNSFQDGNGRWVTPPDRVEYRFGATRGTLIEVFSDGDAWVRFDGERHPETVKWHHLCAVLEAAQPLEAQIDAARRQNYGGAP